MRVGTLEGLAKKLRLDVRWVYLAALYPALISLPYFLVGDRYNSWTRFAYVLFCTVLAFGLLYVMLTARVRHFREQIELRAPRILWGFVILYGLLTFYLAYGLRLANGMGTVGDVALMEQILWAGSQGHYFFSSLYNGSALSAHFALILFPLSLAYALLPNIGTVFALQSLFLALAAVPLYYLLEGTVNRIVALMISISFLINPAIISQHFNLYLNHFAPFFWLGATLAYWRKSFRVFILLCILAASVQEDIAFSLLIFAWLAWLERRTLSWKLFCTVFPLVWFIIGMYFVQVNASANGIALGGHFSDLGQAPAEIAGGLFSNPGVIINKFQFDAPNKVLWAYELFTPLLVVVPLASPMAFAALPDWLVFNFIPLSPDQYAVGWYYSLFIATILFASLALALIRFGKSGMPVEWKTRTMSVVGVLVLCSNLAALPLVLSPDMFKIDGGQRAATLDKISQLIPAQACVVVSTELAQPFAQRYQFYVLGHTVPYPSDCTYFVLDQRSIESQPNGSSLKQLAQDLETNQRYHLILTENQVEFFSLK